MKLIGVAPSSRADHSCTLGSSQSRPSASLCCSSVSQPDPYMKLATWQGGLPHGRSVYLAKTPNSEPTGVSDRSPHWASIHGTARSMIGLATRCLSHVSQRTSGKSETALETTWETLPST